MSRPAVFLDRDGTLNVEVDYLHRPEDLAWIPGAVEAVRRLNEVGLPVLVVTNQAGVARGYYTEADVDHLHAHMAADLAGAGARVDAFYHSPYHPEGAVAAYRRASDCRKPGTGMIERAAREWDVDPARSFIVGDKNSDVEAGRALGMTTFLVRTGYGEAEAPHTRADHVVPDITAAVDRILAIIAPPASPPMSPTEPPTASSPASPTEPPTASPPASTTEPPTASPPMSTTEPPTASPPVSTTEPPTASPPASTTEP